MDYIWHEELSNRLRVIRWFADINRPKIRLIDHETGQIIMDNLGLTAPEPNPFVPGEFPKAGQVWQHKQDPNMYIVVVRFDSFGRGKVNYWYNNVVVRDVPLSYFKERYVFSH
jgi:hypothetical protein